VFVRRVGLHSQFELSSRYGLGSFFAGRILEDFNEEAKEKDS
jgi:hypothetical protein